MSRDRDFDFLSIHAVKCPPLREHEGLAIRKAVVAGVQKSLGKPQNWESQPWHANLTYLQSEQKVVPSKGKLLGMHWGGGQNTAHEFTLKTWPYWQELLALLLQNTDLRLRIVGGPSEVQDIILSPDLQVAAQGRLENHIGKTTLKELAKEISECDYFIGPDSGPLHIADAFAIPSVGIYGPTSEVSWGLLTAQSRCLTEAVPCHPCYQDDGVFPPCPNKKICMTQMTVEKVWHSIQGLISKNH
jgi:heptosyltransferase-2